MKEILKQFNEWKGDHDDDYVYDEISEFFNSLSRGELCEIIEFIEKARVKLKADLIEM